MRAAWLALVVVVAAGGTARAHDFSITATTAVFRADGTYQIDLTIDLDALCLGVAQSEDSAVVAAALRAMPAAELESRIADLRGLLARRTRVRFDGRAVEPTVSFPEYAATPSEHTENPGVLGVTARLTGVVPAGAATFTFWASRAFQAVHLTIRREGVEGEERHVLAVAEESPPFSLTAAIRSPSGWRTAWEYLRLGFEHILPKGIDHILFVLGLFLLSAKWKPLLWQVTAFTIAHSITLGLAIHGVIPLSESFRATVVEPLIALSIAYVAIENIVTSRLHVWRPVIVFGFGLLHGMGFAGVLQELGLPRGMLATALVSFNVGVELGQLAVIGLAFVAVGWARSSAVYRSRVVIPASAAIAFLGVYTAVQRAWLPDWPGVI